MARKNKKTTDQNRKLQDSKFVKYGNFYIYADPKMFLLIGEDTNDLFQKKLIEAWQTRMK